jgi:hypothetical protein
VINVLIPATGDQQADGVAYADDPPPIEYVIPEHLIVSSDHSVRVVPPEALQALLRLSRSFGNHEKRFGRVPKSDQANILALFSLLEEERTLDHGKRSEYLKWTLIKRRAEREDATVKRSREELEKMANFLAQHDAAIVERDGRLRAVTNQLNGLGTLRIWWDRRTDTLSPGVLVGSFVEALYVLLVLSLASSESVAVCARCGKRFSRTKTSQDFCSLRCGNAARKARQREKQKGEINGSRKKR